MNGLLHSNWRAIQLAMIIIALGSAVSAQPAGISSQTISLNSFSRISSCFPGQTIVSPGTQYSITLYAEPSVLPLLSAVVENAILYVGTSGKFKTKLPMRATVTLPSDELVGLQTRSTGDVYVDGKFTVSSLDVSTSSVGTVYASGFDLNDTNVIISSTGSVYLSKTRSADVSISSTGIARIVASEDVEVTLTSTGNLEVEGSAKTSITGFASSIGSVKYTDGQCDVGSSSSVFGSKCQKVTSLSFSTFIPSSPPWPSNSEIEVSNSGSQTCGGIISDSSGFSSAQASSAWTSRNFGFLYVVLAVSSFFISLVSMQ